MDPSPTTRAPAACTSATDASGVPVGAAASADVVADVAAEVAAELAGADEVAADVVAALDEAADEALELVAAAVDEAGVVAVEVPPEQAAATASTAVPDAASMARRGRGLAGGCDSVMGGFLRYGGG